MYTIDDLQVLDDPIAVIRARPSMYVGNGDRGRALAEGLIGNALLLGATDTRCGHVADWYIVSADIDWLTATCRFPAPPLDLFRRIVPLPEAGDNWMRGEVLVTAFSDAVVIATPTSRDQIVGQAPPPSVEAVLLPPGTVRSVAFRLASQGAA